MNPLIRELGGDDGCFWRVVVLLLWRVAFVPLKWVQVKMLPFDNKSEFQVIIDMPDGTPLEQTTRVAQALGELPRRATRSHQLPDLCRHFGAIQLQRPGAPLFSAAASRIRRTFRSICCPGKTAKPRATRSRGACGRNWIRSLRPSARGSRLRKCRRVLRCSRPWSLKSTVPIPKGRSKCVANQEDILRHAGVVDVDWYVEDPQTKYDMQVDLDKAALHGVSAAEVTRTMRIGLSGATAGLLHDPSSREDVPIEVRLSRPDRSGIEALESLKLPRHRASKFRSAS